MIGRASLQAQIEAFRSCTWQRCREWSPLTVQEWQRTLEAFNHSCAYCGLRQGTRGEKLAIDHWIPVRHGGRSEVGSLLPSCKKCNSSKGCKMPWNFCGALKYERIQLLLDALAVGTYNKKEAVKMSSQNGVVEAEVVRENSTELAVMDNAPSFAISIDESKRRVQMLKQFVASQMVNGVDYGVIPGTGDKPTLLKPGAEKLCAIYGYAPTVEILDKTVDWQQPFMSYEVRVSLRCKSTGGVVAEGVGCCNSMERKYKNRDAADMANTILKMAKKRALVDATLSATRASGLFTQDVEDMGDGAPIQPQRQHRAQQAQQAPQQQAQQSNGVSCPKCSGPMWDNRAKKASGEISAKSPDFKCKDRENCDGVIWPERGKSQAAPTASAPIEDDEHDPFQDQ